MAINETLETFLATWATSSLSKKLLLDQVTYFLVTYTHSDGSLTTVIFLHIKQLFLKFEV